MVPPPQGGLESNFGSTLERDGGNANVSARCVEKAYTESHLKALISSQEPSSHQGYG